MRGRSLAENRKGWKSSRSGQSRVHSEANRWATKEQERLYSELI